MNRNLPAGFITFVAVVLALYSVSYGQTAGLAPQASKSASPAAILSAMDAREVIEEYCMDCHNKGTRSGGLALDSLDPSRVAERPPSIRLTRGVNGCP